MYMLLVLVEEGEVDEFRMRDRHSLPRIFAKRAMKINCKAVR